MKLNSADGVTAWVDDQPAPAFSGPEFAAELSSGRHKLTFRVDTAAGAAPRCGSRCSKPAGSSAEYAVVGGR